MLSLVGGPPREAECFLSTFAVLMHIPLTEVRSTALAGANRGRWWNRKQDWSSCALEERLRGAVALLHRYPWGAVLVPLVWGPQRCFPVVPDISTGSGAVCIAGMCITGMIGHVAPYDSGQVYDFSWPRGTTMQPESLEAWQGRVGGTLYMAVRVREKDLWEIRQYV